MEFHLSRYYRLAANVKGIHRIMALYRLWQDKLYAKKFDRFVVLTSEDAEQWGFMPNLCVIPNPICESNQKATVQNSNIVIAAGRHVPQKRFDLLLDAWAMLQPELKSCWSLNIFGDGQLESLLKDQINRLGIQDSAHIYQPSKDIFKEYAKSAFLVLSSEYEGFGMVLVEAMSVGLPVVSFDCKCGPRDIIDDEKNGLLVPMGDCQALSRAISRLMTDEQLRQKMSLNAKLSSESYSENVIMEKWIRLFDELNER